MGQLSLKNILKEIGKQISYVEPNFEYEWEEANTYLYPELRDAKKDAWMKLASNGSRFKYSKVKSLAAKENQTVNNVELEFDSLEPDKKDRFKKAYKKRVIEMPIIIKRPNGEYWLLAGNTRLSGLIKLGVDPTVWFIDNSKKENEKMVARRTRA